MLRLLFFIFTSLYLFPFNVFPQSFETDKNLTHGTLPNGFQYFIYHSTKEKNKADMQLVVKAGSLQEQDNQRGLAHFVEHMAFNGTHTFPGNNVIDTLEKLGVRFGSHLNAHTSYDETVYKLSIHTDPYENISTALSIFRSWASELTFDQAALDKERGVIIEEWRARQNSDKRLAEKYLPLIFHNSHYNDRNPIGDLDVLRTFSRDVIVDFYKTWYRPNLMALLIVTDQDPAQIEKDIIIRFRSLTNKAKTKREYFDLPPHSDTLYSFATDPEAKAVNLTIFKKLPAFPPIDTDDRYNEYLHRHVFNNLSKKRFARLQQLNVPFQSGSASLSSLLLKNSTHTLSATFSESNIQKGLSRFLDEYSRILQHGFTHSEIEDYKTEYLAQLRRSIDSESIPHSSLILSQMKDIFFNGGIILAPDQREELTKLHFQKLDSISLLYYFQSFQQEGNTVVIMTAPDRLVDSLPTRDELHTTLQAHLSMDQTAWHDEEFVPSEILRVPPVAGSILHTDSLPSLGFEIWELSNGAKVWVKHTDERKNYVQMSAFRKGGIYSLDSSLYISGGFTRDIVAPSGAGSFSRHTLTKFLSGNSASALMILSNQREGISASASVQDIQTMLQLIYLKWTSPKVDPEIFDRQKKKALESIHKQKLAPYYKFNQRLSERLNGGKSLAGLITEEKLSSELTADKVLAAYQARFSSAEGFTFVFVGDFDKQELRHLTEAYLAALPGGPISTDYTYSGNKIVSPDYERIETFDNEDDKAIVNIFLQNDNLVYDYPQILEAKVLEEIVKIRLRERLREQHGAVYSVRFKVSTTQFPKPLMRASINFSSDPFKVNFLISESKDILDIIQRDPDSFSEVLNTVKSQLLLDHDSQMSKNTYWTSQLRNYIYNNFSTLEHITEFENMLNSITARAISQLAQKYFDGAQLTEAVRMPKNFNK